MSKKPTKTQEKEMSSGIEKMMKEYKKTGEIKTSRATYHPENQEKAQKQAAAIEYGKHHVGRAATKK